MNLRTTSLKRQHQAWILLALFGLGAYIALVLAFGLGNPLYIFGSHQMRVFLPLVVLLRLVAREFRWDGVVRQEKEQVEKAGGGEDRPVGLQAPSQPQSPDGDVALNDDCGKRVACALSSAQSQSPSPTYTSAPQPQPTTFIQSALQPSGETAEELWNRAREMVHGEIPDPEEDAEYLDLIVSAAERGYVPALAKVGDYAFRRGAFVEAYFWTMMAKCRLKLSGNANPQGLKEIADMLRDIRREWTAAGQPLEFENVYENFPEERGELGRSFLRLYNRKEVGPTRDYIQALADKGNPDAALFVSCGVEEVMAEKAE